MGQAMGLAPSFPGEPGGRRSIWLRKGKEAIGARARRHRPRNRRRVDYFSFRLTGLWPMPSNIQAATSSIAIVTLISRAAISESKRGSRGDPAIMDSLMLTAD